MLPSVPKTVPIKFSDQCIQIINNKNRLKVLKGSKKRKKIISLFKYQSCVYNVQSNSDVGDKGMKMIRKNKLFTSLNSIN